MLPAPPLAPGPSPPVVFRAPGRSVAQNTVCGTPASTTLTPARTSRKAAAPLNSSLSTAHRAGTRGHALALAGGRGGQLHLCAPHGILRWYTPRNVRLTPPSGQFPLALPLSRFLSHSLRRSGMCVRGWVGLGWGGVGWQPNTSKRTAGAPATSPPLPQPPHSPARPTRQEGQVCQHGGQRPTTSVCSVTSPHRLVGRCSTKCQVRTLLSGSDSHAPHHDENLSLLSSLRGG